MTKVPKGRTPEGTLQNRADDIPPSDTPPADDPPALEAVVAELTAKLVSAEEKIAAHESRIAALEAAQNPPASPDDDTVDNSGANSGSAGQSLSNPENALEQRFSAMEQKFDVLLSRFAGISPVNVTSGGTGEAMSPQEFCSKKELESLKSAGLL